MAALIQDEPLDFGDALPDAARQAIKEVLAADPRATRRVYVALARKVWALLIEHRFDAELRDWHDLLHRVRTRIRGDDAAAAERITALADLLRESISLARTSPARAMAARPKARRILARLGAAHGFVARQTLREELGMGSSHLSNVLTQLAAHNLVVRRDKGKEAEFRITEFGRQIVTGESAAEREPHPLFERLKETLDATVVHWPETPESHVWPTLFPDVFRLNIPFFAPPGDERVGLPFDTPSQSRSSDLAGDLTQARVALVWDSTQRDLAIR